MSEKINNKFLESILFEFTTSFGITSYKKTKQFEYLSNYLVVSKQHPEAFESLDQLASVEVDTDENTNYGIDGAAIIVNGNLLLNVEDIQLYTKSRKLEVRLIFIQAKTTSGFDTEEIAKFGSAVQNFFSTDPGILISQELKNVKLLYDQLMSPANIRFIDRKRYPVVDLYYITTARTLPNTTVLGVSKQLEKNVQLADSSISIVNCHLQGVDYLIDTYDDLNNKYTVQINFERRLDLNTISRVEGSYIGYLNFENFLTLISDKNGVIRKNIFYENVRDFQGEENKVNSEMNETLTTESLIDKFILFNNGITVVCKQLTPLQNNEFELGEFQIVNGCQTSNMLYMNREKLIDNKSLWIPIKLIHTTNNEVINNIVKATNRQTPVPDEAFIALERFHQKLQKFYEITSENLKDKIYYERRSKEFQNYDIQIEKYRIVNIHKQIRAFTAIMLNEPHTVANNHPSNILKNKGDLIFNTTHKHEAYLASSYILYFVNSDLASGVIYNSPVLFVFYIGMTMRVLINKKVSLGQFNGRDTEQIYQEIMSSITDIENRKVLYQGVFKVLNGSKRNHEQKYGKVNDRELIRLRSFRDEVVRNLAETLN